MSELRELPSVEKLLKDVALAPLIKQFGHTTVKKKLREAQSQMRAQGAVESWAKSADGYCEKIAPQLKNLAYRNVFNLTGTIVHTNLGRATLSGETWDSIKDLATKPINLEYDLKKGSRGDRDLIVETRICNLLDCEAATIVNNCAAALMLVLNTLALGRKVPVSRGELVEIGGSFRLPELMTRAGCELLEVGTTNRTRLSDFSKVTDESAMLLKIHPSNFQIQGFTEQVSASELADLGTESGLPTCFDLGSGTIVDLTKFGLPRETTAQEVLSSGIDLITFSADKLLGGIQAGVIAGRKDLIDSIKQNPMKRALRADRITLVILESVLKLYDPPNDLEKNLPILRALTKPMAQLEQCAAKLTDAFPSAFEVQTIETRAEIGSGAMPGEGIPSLSLRITHPRKDANKILRELRELPKPVIGRIHEDAVLLDLRSAEPLDELTEQVHLLKA